MKALSKHSTQPPTVLTLLLVFVIGVHGAFIAEPVAAKTIWTVDDDGPGIRSIQQAINMASDGDTIMVLSGTYGEHLFVDKSVSIIGESQAVTIIDGGDTWTIITVAANNVTISGFTLQHATVGMRLEEKKDGTNITENKISSTSAHAIYGDRCGRSIIRNNNISSNSGDGIFLYASGSSSIDNNIISHNSRNGIFIRYSSNNTIASNILQGNGNGIFIQSDEDPLRPGVPATNNEMANNEIKDNLCGIRIEHIGANLPSAQNEVQDNFISNNTLGLNISGSNTNLIIHNNFANNTDQISIQNSYNNTWCGDYYTGGNYWNDHNNADNNWGLDQNQTGKDGIADTPYQVSENPAEVDNYPYLLPNTWLEQPVLEIVSPSNITYRSNNIPLVVDSNKPAQLNYSLDNQTEKVMNTPLALTELNIGIHNITVTACDALNNQASCNVLFSITFLGDINIDWIVNIVDIAIVAFSFGAQEGTERWNPDADVDHNLIINIVDISLVAVDYGKNI